VSRFRNPSDLQDSGAEALDGGKGVIADFAQLRVCVVGMKARMSSSRACVERCTPRRICLSVIKKKKRSN
jgi:hypothetical protein